MTGCWRAAVRPSGRAEGGTEERVDSCSLQDTLTPVSDNRVIPRRVQEYLTAEGRSPFHDWLKSLKAPKTVALIRRRLDRVTMGNLGDYAPVGGEVFELRIAHGPGYRIYFGDDEGTLVILLCGGDKRSQRADIQRAKAYWQEYRRVGHAEANARL